MVDYTKATGSSGTMMIRDLGSTVEFWLKASSATWAADLPYSWSYPGSSGSAEFNFQSGGSWQKLRSFTLNTSATVTFSIGNSGTSGLGGPTTFSKALSRSTIPQAPDKPTFSSLDNDSVIVSFTDNGNGGDAIDARQLGWAYGVVANPTNTLSSDGSTTFSGFAPGATISVWARVHNSNGWSPWSARANVTFHDVPDAPGNVVVGAPTMTTVRGSFTGNYNGGSPVLEHRIGFGTNPSAPTQYVSGWSNVLISPLVPGVVNYFWAQQRNAYGWSPLSTRTSVKPPAGARVNVGGVWKDAVPYVRDGGIWKPAEPYVKDLGVWMKPL